VVAALLVAGCGTGGAAEAAQRPDLQNGKTLFVSTCAACHTLSAAGTNGTIGPNLDNAFAGDVKQGYPQSSIENVVLDQIRLGSGPIATYTNTKLGDYKLQTPMPADLVKGQDAIDVAAYVASVAGQSGYTTPGGFASLGTNGEAIFKGAGCAGCHTLAAAGATGTTGPNLDQLKPPYPIIVRQVTNGGVTMPPFQGRLTPAQIQAVAKYVATSAGK
jgi:cbb3-type cytochrome c oxidase subunit III